MFSLKSLIRILKSITRKEERNVRLELFKILAEKYVAGQLRIGRKEKSIKGFDEMFCLLYCPGLKLNFRDELSNFWSIYNFRHSQIINNLATHDCLMFIFLRKSFSTSKPFLSIVVNHLVEYTCVQSKRMRTKTLFLICTFSSFLPFNFLLLLNLLICNGIHAHHFIIFPSSVS